jgi:hypothetical protein
MTAGWTWLGASLLGSVRLHRPAVEYALRLTKAGSRLPAAPVAWVLALCRARLVTQLGVGWGGGCGLGDWMNLDRNGPMMSIGRGKTTVEFWSAPSSSRVWR